jgi:hypothetical protein
MRFIVTLFLLLVLNLFIGSCNKGPTGGIPFYMAMDTAVVTAPTGMSASSNTQGIQDVWVEEGSSNIGAYELPCNFPVLDKGPVYFVVHPGVWQSAQNTNPVIYPFMSNDTFTLQATPGNKYTHVPKFTYLPAAKVMFNDDFELGTDYNSNMVRTTDSVKYGTHCGKITVGPNDSSVVACQVNASGGNTGSNPGCPYTLRAGQEIWVELDYKSQVPFWSGIIAHFSSGAIDTIQVLFLLPTETWSKQYIKLSETVGNEGASTFNLYFQALNPSGFAGGSVYLDNIRLVYM